MKESWLTRPLFTCPPRMLRVLGVGFVVLLVAGIFSPTLVTLAWHLYHGNTIECRREPVFVPSRWIAEIDDGNDAMLTKLPIIVPLNPRVTPIQAWIAVGQSSPVRGVNLEDQYKSFRSWFSNLHSDLGEGVSGPVRMGSGSQESFCMEGDVPRTNRSSVSCLILGGKWRADFMGDKKYVEDFFKVIHKLN